MIVLHSKIKHLKINYRRLRRITIRKLMLTKIPQNYLTSDSSSCPSKNNNFPLEMCKIRHAQGRLRGI